MLSELLHGLLMRAQRDHGADHPAPGVAPHRPSLRIGVIPGGQSTPKSHRTVKQT